MSQAVAMPRHRSALHWAVLALPVLLIALMLGTALGETRIPFDVVLKVLANKLFGAGYAVDRIDTGIVWNYRLARALVAACCGAGLALAGVVLQALLRNALADPYLLGISAGASTGAVAVTVVGLGGGAISMSAGAFTGALMAFGFVAALAHLAGGGTGLRAARGDCAGRHCGVAAFQCDHRLSHREIGQCGTGAGHHVLALGQSERGALDRCDERGAGHGHWRGGLSRACAHARCIYLCADSAASLGISVRRAQVVLIGVAALVTAVIVSIVGSIGFVGLVIPHAMRMLVGTRHGQLVPASALAGAVFLIAADVISRVIIPGQVLPIGVVTALVGAPVFALILIGRRGAA